MARKLFQVVKESWGGTRRVVVNDLTRKEAMEFCEEHKWVLDENGYIWDLSLEEQD